MSDKEKKAVTVEQVTRHVRALLISAPNGLNLCEIQNDYLSIIGKPFPYRELGYKEPLELVKAMPDVVQPTWIRGQLILRGIADQTSEHIARLVAKQKKESKRRATHVIRKKPLQAPSVPPFIRSKIQDLLTNYPSGILGSMFLNAFTRHFHITLDFRRLGFDLLLDLLKSIPDIARFENIKMGGYRIYGTSNSQENKNKTESSTKTESSAKTESPIKAKSSKNAESSKKELPFNNNNTKELISKVKNLLNSQSGVCHKLRDEIAQVLSKRPNGVWAARLPIEYKKCFNKELNMRHYGFTTIVELADAMSDVVRIERPTKTGDWLLHGVQRIYEQPEIETSKPTQDQDNIPNSLHHDDNTSTNSQQLSNRILPVDDGVGQGTYFQKPTLPDSGYITLYIPHCVDPSNFWVIFTDEWPKVEALSKDISTFYNSSEGDKYLMPQWLLSVGQVCCAWCEDYEDWYRAVITGVTSMQSIEVSYVDYGNHSRVALSELRVLRSSFLKIPRQACHAQLAYIKPVKGVEWSPGGCHRFYHLTKNYKALFGLLCGTKDGKMCLCLSDTSSSEDIHINDLLVDEGYAVFCPDSAASPCGSPVRPFFHQNTITEKGDGDKDNKPPGLPPARKEQELFNQHIATTIGSTYPTDLPFQLQHVCNGEQQTHRSSSNDIDHDSQSVDKESQDNMDSIEDICDEVDQDTEEEYIFKRINLMDICTLHVINYYKVPYVTSADISVLLWDSDVLRAMLRQKKMVVPKLVLSNEEDGELIELLVKHDVRGVMDGDTQRSFVTLYPLSCVPNVLRKFNHPLEDLVSRVESELQQYEDEGDDYWLVKDTESESTETDSESRDGDMSSQIEQLALDELKLIIQALQFRRKRILQELMSPAPDGTPQNTVEELVDVENKIEKLRREVSRKERQE